MTLFVLDPTKLPGAPDPLQKGWGATIGISRGVDALEALRGAVVTATTPDAVALVSLDPTYPNAIVLPPAIIALEPNRGTPLPGRRRGDLGWPGGRAEIHAHHPDGRRGSRG